MGETLATKRRRGEGEYRQLPLLSTLFVRGRRMLLLVVLEPFDPVDEIEPPAREQLSLVLV